MSQPAAAAGATQKEVENKTQPTDKQETQTTDAQVDDAASQLAGLSVGQDNNSGSSSSHDDKHVTAAAPAAPVAHPERPLGPAAAPPRVTLSSLAARIASGELKRIVLLSGAGISVSAGIPDFRSPGTGLYANLQKYNLPHPTAVFELSYFRRNPAPFFMLAKELYPGVYRPTPTHMFIRALDEHGYLLRAVTQNIDGLELVAGLSPDKLIQAHGGFSRAACIDCHRAHTEAYVKEAVFADRIPRCTSSSCGGGLVKPAITFFGEGLPEEFGRAVVRDLPRADLLIVAGTSLQVQPFASLIGRVGKDVPRILINRECVGAAPGCGVDGGGDDGQDEDDEAEMLLSQHPQYSTLKAQLASTRSEQMRSMLSDMLQQIRRRLFGDDDGGLFDFRSGWRDVFVRDDCDSGVRRLAKLIGDKFAQRLEQLVEEDRQKHPRAAAAFAQGAEAEAGKEAAKIAQAIATSAMQPASTGASSSAAL
jgi:NAD-dependent SIR2 family protein deacetylase